jgi:threonine/homoserine/homoserine lactone efflux protein
MAPLVSDLPIVLLALSLLEQLPPLFLRGVSVVGGLFVLYLAWEMWGRWRASAGRVKGFKPAEGSGLRRGALINLLGPGPYLFWTLVLGPVLLAALRASPLHGGVFVLGFYRVFIGGLLGLVGLFDQARRLGPRVVRALLLVVFGVGLLRKGL